MVKAKDFEFQIAFKAFVKEIEVIQIKEEASLKEILGTLVISKSVLSIMRNKSAKEQQIFR